MHHICDGKRVCLYAVPMYLKNGQSVCSLVLLRSTRGTGIELSQSNTNNEASETCFGLVSANGICVFLYSKKITSKRFTC